MVGTAGFEPATSASRTLRATKLRYVPNRPAGAGARHRLYATSDDPDGAPHPVGEVAREVAPEQDGAGLVEGVGGLRRCPRGHRDLPGDGPVVVALPFLVDVLDLPVPHDQLVVDGIPVLHHEP